MTRARPDAFALSNNVHQQWRLFRSGKGRSTFVVDGPALPDHAIGVAMHENSSGHLRIEAGMIRYAVASAPDWQLPITDVALVGEYTTDAGPAGDDYFLVFVRADGTCFTASFYAQGRDEAIAALSAALRSEIRPGLCDSTSWRSRVLWPADVKGQALFDLVVEPPRSFGGKMLRAAGLQRAELVLSTAVRARLGLPAQPA